MNHRERLRLLLRSQLFYIAVLIFVAGLVILSVVDQNDTGAQIPGAILVQGGIIIGFWAYRRTRFIITDPASQACLKHRSRMGMALVIGMVCVGFMLTPVVLCFEIQKMPGLLFWYSVATGLVGLLGLTGLIVWLRSNSS
ncbi:MAG TPA: hypothetical protein VGN23_11420 [Verrucomicrobiae bacterium]|jgi:FtsH-binding integral membrane protein